MLGLYRKGACITPLVNGILGLYRKGARITPLVNGILGLYRKGALTRIAGIALWVSVLAPRISIERFISAARISLSSTPFWSRMRTQPQRHPGTSHRLARPPHDNTGTLLLIAYIAHNMASHGTRSMQITRVQHKLAGTTTTSHASAPLPGTTITSHASAPLPGTTICYIIYSRQSVLSISRHVTCCWGRQHAHYLLGASACPIFGVVIETIIWSLVGMQSSTTLRFYYHTYERC